MLLRLWKLKKQTIWLGLIGVIILGAGGIPTSTAQNNIVLTLAIPNVWEDVLTEEVLAQFTAQNPGVSVRLESTGNQFLRIVESDLENRFSATEELVATGDVIFVEPSDLYVEATQAGYFLDLAPLVNSDATLNTADFFPAVWQSYQWNGGVWALPVSTDVILVTYDPAAFDAAGLAYPNERWTVDDFANAARRLTQYNADGTVALPGMTTLSGGETTEIFLRSLLTSELYDPTTLPNTPQFTDPNLEYILTVAYDLQQEGVVMTPATMLQDVEFEDIPLRIEGRFGYAQGGFNGDTSTTRLASLLPNNTAGLSVQGFAVSAGTLYPEQSYALAKFLTTLPELANSFTSVMPARQSFVGQTTTNQGGGVRAFGGGIPEAIQPVINQAMQVALPLSEMRYADYLSQAASDMVSSGIDAVTALQNAEATAQANMQTALGLRGTLSLSVATPAPTPVLAAGEIALKFGYQSGFGGGPGGGEIPNENEWQTVINEFIASNAVVGNVELEALEGGGNNLATLTQEYDCFVLQNNVVQGNDLSTLLNLDPLLDTDPTFDRNDVLGNTLAQVQQDNRTWAMPLALQPQMLSYNPDLFNLAGVPLPTNGWTTGDFIDALQRLKTVLPEDTAPFNPNDPSGSYMNLLIAAFGGIPIDYRTTPATINFTDPNTVAAIRQVLDLAKDGYIAYSGLSLTGQIRVFINTDDQIAISSNSLNRFIPQGLGPNPRASMSMTFYPTGTDYNVMAYDITTGYISTNAQNPEACYQWLSTLARNPQLFSGMPARRSLLNDPTVQATQDPALVSAYQLFDSLLQAPNTIVLPVASLGGGGAANFITEYWLKQAFDRYVLEDADLEAELAQAQAYTQAYLGCAASITMTTGGTFEEQQGVFEQINQCASSVDPSFSLFD